MSYLDLKSILKQWIHETCIKTPQCNSANSANHALIWDLYRNFLGGKKVKVKGKGRFLELFQHWGHLAYCIIAPNKFLHSSPEAPRNVQMRETSTSEGGNYYQILLANSNLRKSARIFLHVAKLAHGTDSFTSPPKEGILRIFQTPEKSNGFGRVWTRELGFQWPVC